MASPMVGLAAAAMLGIDQSAVYWAIGGGATSCSLSSPFHARGHGYGSPATRHAECRARRRAQWRRVSDENHDNRTYRSGSRVAARHERGTYRRELAIAVGVMTVIVAPFLINCAVATGDPFYAINNHTDFYLKREGVPDPRPISAVAYSLDKFESRPIAATDNAVRGVFVYPFSNKWVGLDTLVPGPWNGAGLSRDSRSRRLAVVSGRPAPPRHVLRIARPLQHDVDRAAAAPSGGLRSSLTPSTSLPHFRSWPTPCNLHVQYFSRVTRNRGLNSQAAGSSDQP